MADAVQEWLNAVPSAVARTGATGQEGRARERVRHDHRVVRLLRLSRKPRSRSRQDLLPGGRSGRQYTRRIQCLRRRMSPSTAAASYSPLRDRIGRRSMFVISIMLMGGENVLVGLLPSYRENRHHGADLPLILRVIQAIGLGGEWGGTMLIVTETAPPNRRGLFGSIVQMGDPLRPADCDRSVRARHAPAQIGIPELGLAAAVLYLADLPAPDNRRSIHPHELNKKRRPRRRMRATKSRRVFPLVDAATTTQRETSIQWHQGDRGCLG